MAKRGRITFQLTVDYDTTQYDKPIQDYLATQFRQFCNIAAGELLIANKNPKIFFQGIYFPDIEDKPIS